MKYSIYTVLNDAYWRFGQIFIRSLYDKIDINNINKIYISDTGLKQNQIELLKSYDKIEIIDSEIVTNFNGGSWSDEWHEVVSSKTLILKKILMDTNHPVVMIDADCLFYKDISGLINMDYDIQVCKRNNHIPWLGSYVSINNPKKGIEFINKWRQNIYEDVRYDQDGHLMARESPALGKTVEETSLNIGGVDEHIVSASHEGMFNENTHIIHFKGSSKSKNVKELYEKRLGTSGFRYGLAKQYLILNILFLCNREYYYKKMSRVRFHGMEAIGHESNVMWWGPGWEGYDNDKTVQENINLLEDKCDLIVAYKPLEMKDMKNVNVPVCLRYNEMYDEEWTRKEIDESGAELIICHHENDMEPYIKHYGNSVKFYHVAHCAEASIFRQLHSPKQYDVLLVGALGARTKMGQHYPLRDRMAQLIQKMPAKYKVGIHQRPHGRQDNAFENVQAKQFAAAINSSKICITDSGAPNSRFGKYVEIPMCGTVIAGDIPGEDQDNFRKFIIEINMEMSDSEIINKLCYYLDNEEKLLILKQRGLDWSKGYTQEKYAHRFLDAARNYLERNQ
tara:strand:+ start:16523 stop:18214 length:1692 start_codon:yes stop_codon:yes gene_type:complete